MLKRAPTFVLIFVLAFLLGEHYLEAARDGSGTYVVPTTATPGAVISSSDWNENFTDVGAEITNSLPRDGQAGMSGAFKAADGSVSAPGIAFVSDSDTGIYRTGSGAISFVSNGTAIFTMSSTGTSLVPPGTVAFFAGTSNPPTGWLRANGQNVSRTTYANLFTALSTTFGTGNGSTTFGLPDCDASAPSSQHCIIKY